MEKKKEEKIVLSNKVDIETHERFKNLQNEAGETAQEFVETLLAAYTQVKVDTNTTSPVYKEQGKVRQSLAQVERVVCAFLELASDDKIAAEEKVKETVGKAQEKVGLLEKMVEMSSGTISELEKERDDLHEKINALVTTAESLDTLKTAWTEKESSWLEKESNLNARISELDTEAKQARILAEKVAGLEKELVQKNSVIALAEQQARHDQETIKDLKELLKTFRGDLAVLNTNLSNAHQEINTEKLNCSTRLSKLEKEHSSQINAIEKEHSSEINKIEKSAAEEKGRLFGELSSLKNQLISQKELQKKNKTNDQEPSLPGLD